MADDRSNSQGFGGQVHSAGHVSGSPLVTPDTGTVAIQDDNCPPRGPRTLLLRRGENGFGFTLRHFIVYPPESCCMLPGHERTRIEEPMDTIFVKQVRGDSPAAEAGLRTGDRVVSVDGKPTRGEQYAKVVQRIQTAGPWLRLLVVSKEDDILQRYFGETAHNPETNQRRPRLRSPDRRIVHRMQRRSISMIPGLSPRSRQSWVSSGPFESPVTGDELSGEFPGNEGKDDQHQLLETGKTCRLNRRPLKEMAIGSYNDAIDDKKPGPSRNYRQQSAPEPKDDLTGKRVDQIYERINVDPIYDCVKIVVGESNEEQEFSKRNSLQQRFNLMPRYPLSRAEPQVPRPNTRRVTSRRASEGTMKTTIDPFREEPRYSSRDDDSLGFSSIDSKIGDSSPINTDDPSSYDSSSTLTGNEKETSSNDSVIMTRLRKSFEQKEEFLRRPSQPIGWFVPEEASARNNNVLSFTVTPREFYARPQKLQRQLWPPVDHHQDSRTSNPSLVKPFNHNVQRVKTDRLQSEIDDTANGSNGQGQFYSSPFYEDDRDQRQRQQQVRTAAGGKSTFVGTLSRIQENITSATAFRSDARNGSSSLPSSPGPEKKVNDKLPVFFPQGLQIVSKRAKQFESGRLVSDDDEPTGDRTSLYKSELARLSNKRTVPNVAVRKREFESKAEAQEPRRLLPTKSLDGSTGAVLSGNRTIPIGSKQIHCEPPTNDLLNQTRSRDLEGEVTQSRVRSNSLESWETSASSLSQKNYDSKRKLKSSNAVVDEPTDTSSLFFIDAVDDYTNETIGKRDKLLASDRATGDAHRNGVVFRREKNTQITDEERATRRVSYLKATWGERMYLDSDLDLSDAEPVHALLPSEQEGPCTEQEVAREIEPIDREGSLHVKFTVLDGKRSSDRSWKQVWGILRGSILSFHKDRHSQSPSLGNEVGENAGQSVDVGSSLVDIAEDYTKRKHVLRLANPNAEILLQTEDSASMALWLRALDERAAPEKPSEIQYSVSSLKQQAVPQTPGPNTTSGGIVTSSGQRLSPLPGHKGIKKLTSFRNRSPTGGQSPVNKTRKPATSQPVDSLVSPKTKTWKGRVAKQLRRMHGQAGGSLPSPQLPVEGATFKVPLELCPPSSFSEYIPLIVEMCTSIVEARGLEVVGIYRVPGNTAAISQLTDTVNKGFENINLQDPRWSDVNVISSLLKSFFRQLPDSLLTAELYPMFIDADKVEDPQRRMTTIRKLLRDLPEHHFETLKYLMFHLKRIVEHSEVNKMEAKNLAIVFGPTLVRASGSRDNMVTMVTDMSHQCRIVESLLNNVDWFFSDDDLDDLSRLSVNLSLPADSSEIETTNHNLLLNNIQKVEGSREIASARDIVSSIISAANRKIQRRRKGPDETDSESHEISKSKAKQDSVERLPSIRRSMALNERQCSVSEIVLMHESKKHRCSSDLRETVDSESKQAPTDGSCRNDGIIPESIERTAVSESSRLSSETGFDASSTLSSTSNDSNKQSNDEVAIRSYAGLSATTQERIRRFEQETKAMLQRDQNRQRREAEKREEERRRIEMEWQLAKREMENDDLLDSIADDTRLSTSGLSSFPGDGLLSRSRMPSLSIAVQQEPTRRVAHLVDGSTETLPNETANNAVIIKKLKTDKEPILGSLPLPPVRYGSLDSLHDTTPELCQPSFSPSHHQQRKQLSGDVSDDGSDLLTSLTTTFDRKWRSLVNSAVRTSVANTATPQSVEAELTTQQVDDRKKTDNSQSASPFIEAYRDPSLHKSTVQKYFRQKNDAPEKDTDSSITDKNVDMFAAAAALPDNDRDYETNLPAIEKESPNAVASGKQADDDVDAKDHQYEVVVLDSNYSNKLEKFESLTNYEVRTRLKRSESLNKRSETATSKLKRSESLNKHSTDRLSSPTSGKLKRSESLNKHADRSDSPNGGKLKRQESLTKTEKTECNISKRRQSIRKDSGTKLKRKNGMPERSIKRRHTVGGTKDFDKVHWLDNKLQTETERAVRNEYRPKKSQLRTSSPDLLSTGRIGLAADSSFLIEVSFRGPSNVVFNVTNTRPQSLPDASLASKVFKLPLESHV